MKAVLLLMLSGGLGACTSSGILRDRDYEPALQAYSQDRPDLALRVFPEGERAGFITSVEKAWLSQWDGKWRPSLLAEQAETLEAREPIRLSHEARIFWRDEKETEYMPAEHEITVLHLLYATHLLQSGQTEEAGVELRRAGLVLERDWDDQGLRLWLAALWTAAGDWEEARVDLRRAHELGGSRELAVWASRERPPPGLRLHFIGVAPSLRWSGASHRPEFLAPGPAPALAVVSSTRRWFDHHLEKDHTVRVAAREGHHWIQYAGNETLSATEMTGAKALSWGIRLTGVAVGVGLAAGTLYVISQSGGAGGSGGEYLIYAAVAAGVGIWKFGEEIDHAATRYVQKEERRKQELLRTYRLVRFLPAWVGLSMEMPGVAGAAGQEVALSNGVVLAREDALQNLRTDRGPVNR